MTRSTWGVVGRLEDMDVRMHSLTLGGVDLTSTAGRITMGVINAVAQFERDVLSERMQSGLARAQAEGKRIERSHSLSAPARAAIAKELATGESVAALARRHGTSRQTIKRMRDATAADETGATP